MSCGILLCLEVKVRIQCLSPSSSCCSQKVHSTLGPFTGLYKSWMMSYKRSGGWWFVAGIPPFLAICLMALLQWWGSGGGTEAGLGGRRIVGTGVRGKREGGDMYSDGSNVRWGDVNTPRGKRWWEKAGQERGTSYGERSKRRLRGLRILNEKWANSPSPHFE